MARPDTPTREAPGAVGVRTPECVLEQPWPERGRQRAWKHRMRDAVSRRVEPPGRVEPRRARGRAETPDVSGSCVGFGDGTP